MTPATHNITAYIGATLGPKVFTFKDSEGAAVDLTGWSVWAHVKRTASDTLFLDLAPTITDAANGEVTLTATDEATALWSEFSGVWDLFMEDSGGIIKGPYVAGTFIIARPVTEPS